MESIASSSRSGQHFFCEGTPSRALLFLLPPCIILLVLDIALRRSDKPSETPSTADDRLDLALAHRVDPHPIRRLGVRAQQLSENFRVLEQQFLRSRAQSRSLSERVDIRRCRSLPSSPHRLLYGQDTGSTSSSSSPLSAPSSVSTPPSLPLPSISIPSGSGSTPRRRTRQSPDISPAFKDFCDHLLSANRLLAKEREIKSLKEKLRSSNEAFRSEAFTSFCDKVLTTNALWRAQSQLADLKAENEKMHKSRVGVVTRAAKQMVLDVQKERMVEEFCKDLIEEAAESRKEVTKVKSEREKEIREVIEEWREENRRLRQEVKMLKAAQEAKALEQELSNDLEDRLVERLDVFAQKQKELEVETETEADDAPTPIATLPPMPFSQRDNLPDPEEYYDSDDDDADTYLEEMSTMSSTSSTSTRVGSPSPSPMKKPRVRLHSLPTSAAKARIHRKLDNSGYVGFSFNPLFYGTREEISPKVQKAATNVLSEKVAGKAPVKHYGGDGFKSDLVRSRAASSAGRSTTIGPAKSVPAWRV
ncbi:hypothetical protein FA15DRAFT_673728 [Coprinopsis marcescibilis]|uniref:Uncharacterized protein n=1 Tax=Coprinopsis marcescibilis TaxID=230819 RepID=A0A5C3KIU4_COPMA|nr:hypothetical protein FA15DRAFT_673728 [Coprinopsis marcescibilis]